MTRLVSTTFAGAVVLLLIQVAPAHAQATRTWVSGVGDDANPCSRTAPCKTFAGAISKTAAMGEINVLDPGGFGAVTITKSITIRSDHIEAGVLVSGTNGIVVNVASTDTVILEGLDIEGLGTGLDGVLVNGSGSVTIIRCAIRHFTHNGVNLTSSSRGFLEDSLIASNGGGLNMAAMSGGIVHNTILDQNTNYAIQTAGPSTLILSGSTLAGSSAGIVASGGATVVSYGNNVIRGTGAPTSTLPLR